MTKFISFIKNIPDWLEFSAVMAVCFGISTLVSVYAFVSGKAFTRIEFTDARIIATLIFEGLISAICIGFLWLRGYVIWQRLRFLPSFKGTFLSIGLFFLTYLVYFVSFNLVYAIVGPNTLPIAAYHLDINIAWVIIVSLLNPLFEEVFVVGYIFDRLQGQNIWLVIILSSLIRTSYHLYQGWIGIISILPLGLIFAIAYSRTKNLWPIYLTHAILDLIGLASSSSG